MLALPVRSDHKTGTSHISNSLRYNVQFEPVDICYVADGAPDYSGIVYNLRNPGDCRATVFCDATSIARLMRDITGNRAAVRHREATHA